jgi:hypothetical protein
LIGINAFDEDGLILDWQSSVVGVAIGECNDTCTEFGREELAGRVDVECLTGRESTGIEVVVVVSLSVVRVVVWKRVVVITTSAVMLVLT